MKYKELNPVATEEELRLYNPDLSIKELKSWGLDLSTLHPLLQQTLSLIEEVEQEKAEFLSTPSLSNIKSTFSFSSLEIKQIINHFSVLSNYNITPQELLISYSESQITNECILDGCRALVVAMTSQPRLIPQYLVSTISLLMACEKEAYSTIIHPDNVYRKFFAANIFLLLFKCKLRVHEGSNYTNAQDYSNKKDDEMLIILDEPKESDGIPVISILDEVLLGWVDVYMEYCLYSKQWDMIYLLHSGFLDGFVTSHDKSRIKEAIDFNLPRHLIIDKISATVPLYQHLLTGNLVFSILISLYISVGYEYCSTISGWEVYPNFITPMYSENTQPDDTFENIYNKNTILNAQRKLGLFSPSKIENYQKSGLSQADLFKSIVEVKVEPDEENELTIPNKNDAENSPKDLSEEYSDTSEREALNKERLIEIAKLLIHKGLECFGYLSSMGSNWLTDLDRKLVSWNTPFDVHAALVLCGADFFFALGHIPLAFSLYYELGDKLEIAWKVRSNPHASEDPSWYQNFGGTRDGSYLDIYETFTPNLPFRGIYSLANILLSYRFFYEASIEYSTILATYPHVEISEETLKNEDVISMKEYNDDSMYGLSQSLHVTFTSSKQFIARCLKKLMISLEMRADNLLNNSEVLEFMLILAQFGWPYWTAAFENSILLRLKKTPPKVFSKLLKYLKHPSYASKILAEYMACQKLFPLISFKAKPNSQAVGDILADLQAIIIDGQHKVENKELDFLLYETLIEFLKVEILSQ